ncbi:MAG: hypothetical protein EZS28_022613 [Streblomastix strix]|uniref:Uncharacterized protein n=1 Tax=Streblomastix strix TaxID=222440 RepID=A0A5J4VGZ0_9EUKA|nr:MAG: hypothetical protein EZS28_022613 [Streblomastix strix]
MEIYYNGLDYIKPRIYNWSPIARSPGSLRLRCGRTGESWGSINRRGKRIRRVVMFALGVMSDPTHFSGAIRHKGGFIGGNSKLRNGSRIGMEPIMKKDHELWNMENYGGMENIRFAMAQALIVCNSPISSTNLICSLIVEELNKNIIQASVENVSQSDVKP